MKQLLSLALLLFSFSSFALTGALQCEVLIPQNLGMDEVLISIDEMKAEALINGRELGVTRLGRFTETDYKLTLTTPDFIEVLDINFTADEFQNGGIIRGMMAYGEVYTSKEILYEKLIMNCTPVILDI